MNTKREEHIKPGVRHNESARCRIFESAPNLRSVKKVKTAVGFNSLDQGLQDESGALLYHSDRRSVWFGFASRLSASCAPRTTGSRGLPLASGKNHWLVLERPPGTTYVQVHAFALASRTLYAAAHKNARTCTYQTSYSVLHTRHISKHAVAIPHTHALAYCVFAAQGKGDWRRMSPFFLFGECVFPPLNTQVG